MGERPQTAPWCRNGGGPAPCIDDLCHHADVTLCGVWVFDPDEFDDIDDIDEDYGYGDGSDG